MLNLSHFKPEEVEVKIADMIMWSSMVSMREKTDNMALFSVSIPVGICYQKVPKRRLKSSFSTDGVLTIKAKKKSN